jgi:hypothetical protein
MAKGRPCEPNRTKKKAERRHKRHVFDAFGAACAFSLYGCIRIRPGHHDFNLNTVPP